ncbi:methionyl-tRNA formyltransferase [bacterium]|nr:methionyl-tRNA formyltransferase [bacterium]
MNPTTPLKIVFMGTPDFAVPALEKLHSSIHQIQLVVTIPDKQQGRGRKLRSSAVKQTAQALGLPISQPENLKDSAFISEIKSLLPDLIVVVAFQILPVDVFTLPRFGSINLHASLLPRYRGAAPIHWALLNGDRESGVTTFFLKRRVDTGNIILQSKIPIKEDDNLQTLYNKLCNLGADLVLDTLNYIASGKVVEGEQDNSLSTPAPKVTSDMQLLNFEESAEKCHNRVRAFAPTPGAFTYRNGSRLKLLSTELSNLVGKPGTVISLAPDSFTVACGMGSLIINYVQPESKKAMQADSYLRGNPMQIGDHLG